MTRPATSSAAPELFARPGWWEPGCRDYASLRSVSRFRLQMLQQWLGGALAGARIVDLGCGGGLLAIPLAAAAASVIGIDRSGPALGEARQEAARRGLANAEFVQADLTSTTLAAGHADLVLLADVLEHLPRPERAVVEAARLLRPGGHLFVNTINRSWRARFLAITLGEGLGFIPRGTHDHAWFLRPEEVDGMGQAVGLRRVQRSGERPAVWASLHERVVVLRPCRSVAVGYCALFEKGEAR